MILRELCLNTDWPLLSGFWQRKLPAVPIECLPPTGLVATTEEGTLLCGAFLVKSDTNTASLAFVTGNPDVLKDERSEALDAVILALVEIAMKNGFTLVGVATNVPALQARYERLGFAQTDENVKCYGGYL